MTEPRLLIIRLSSLGDVVHALPAAVLLHRALPEARLGWLVEKRWAALLVGNPDLDEVITADTAAWRRSLMQRATWQAMRYCRRQLLARHYQAAIDFQGLYKSGLMAWSSGATQVVGFAGRFCREPGAAIFYDRTVIPAGLHVVDHNLSLARYVTGVPPWRDGAEARPEPKLPAGVPFFLPRSEEAEAYVEQRLAVHREGSLQGEPFRRGGRAPRAEENVAQFFVVNPGGGWRSKCWPPERYGELCRRLAGSGRPGGLAGWRAVVSYGPGEESLVEAVRRAAGQVKLVAFPTDLLQLIALLRRAELFIGGDTGPLHLAVAGGTPVVGLYGPTDPARNGPYSPLDVVVCNPAERDGVTYRRESEYSPSMLSISVEQVVAAVHERLRSVGFQPDRRIGLKPDAPDSLAPSGPERRGDG